MAEDLIVQSVGAKVYIGPTTVADELSEFVGLSYTELAEIANVGEFGKSFQTVNFVSLSTARTRKRKGAYDQGNIQLQMGRIPSDAGQALIKRAADDLSHAYAIKIELGDGTATDNPTTFYFAAIVMSYTTNIGEVNNVVRATTTLSITSDVFEIAGGQAATTYTNSTGVKINRGVPVYAPTGTTIAPADANDTAPKAVVVGLVDNTANVTDGSIDNGDTGVVRTAGTLTMSDWTDIVGATTLEVGVRYYLSATVGKLTSTPPVGASTYRTIVGDATSTTTLALNIWAPVTAPAS